MPHRERQRSTIRYAVQGCRSLKLKPGLGRPAWARFVLSPNPTNAQQVQFLKQHSIPGNQFKIDGIRALGAPSGDEAKIEAILDAAQQAVNQAKRNPQVLLKAPGPPAFAKVDKLTAAYGLKGCSGD